MNDTLAMVPVPPGFTADEVGNIPTLARQDPERCMMLVDEVMKNHVQETRARWIAQASILYFVKEHELWKHHPASFSSFFEWCAQPEIELPPSVVSDMLAIVQFAPAIQSECNTDIFEVIRERGHSNVRQLIPSIRDAYRNNTMAEEVTPLLDEIWGSSFRDILEMTKAPGKRMPWDPEVIVEEIEGPNGDAMYNITFTNLTFDDMELLDKKTTIKRWYTKEGGRKLRIDNPLNALPERSTDD